MCHRSATCIESGAPRVAALLEEYNNPLTVAPQLDGQFEEIARERTRRHPLRTYVTVPLGRAATMWLIKRVAVDHWDPDRASIEATALGLTSATLKQWALDYAQAHKR